MEPVATKVTSAASFTSALSTAYFGLTLNELGVIVGIIATIVTVVMNWYFKSQHLKLARLAACMRSPGQAPSGDGGDE